MLDRYPNTMLDPHKSPIDEWAERRARAQGKPRRRAKRPVKRGPYLPGFVPRHRAEGPGQ